MIFIIHLRLVCFLVKKHDARIRFLLNSGYLRLGRFKGSIHNLLREAIIWSLKGAATGLVRYMGSQVEVERINLKLEMVYGIVESFNVLM